MTKTELTQTAVAFTSQEKKKSPVRPQRRCSSTVPPLCGARLAPARRYTFPTAVALPELRQTQVGKKNDLVNCEENDAPMATTPPPGGYRQEMTRCEV